MSKSSFHFAPQNKYKTCFDIEKRMYILVVLKYLFSMELISTCITAAQWLGSYFLTRKLDKIFSDEGDFIQELSSTINLTIDEYSKKYPEEDKDGKFSFYKSQKIIDELLKYRIMPDEHTDLNALTDILTLEQNIIPPRLEQIKNFYEIFIENIKANDKLRRLEIKESFEEEIFHISNALYEGNERIDNLISTYNGDLQTQWKGRLNTYIETLKKFKPQTALELLKSLEQSFEDTTNKPDNALHALIKYQEGVCLSLLGDENANMAYIDAHKKDKKSIKYKEKAAFAYYLIEDFKQAEVLIDELLKEDEYNPTAWGLRVFLATDYSTIIKQMPTYARNSIKFQGMLYNHYIHENNFEIISLLQKEGVILSGQDVNPITIDINSFYMGIFFINVMIGDYLQNYNYVDFSNDQTPDNELARKLKSQLQSLIKEICNSEIKDKYQRLFLCESLIDFVITRDEVHLLAMRDYILKDKTLEVYFINICANLLQIESCDKEALDLLDTCKVDSFEMGLLKSYIHGKNNDHNRYITSMRELYISTREVNKRIIYAYLNSIFCVREFGCICNFSPELFFANKIFYSPQAKELCEIISLILINETTEDYQEKLTILIDHFAEDEIIMLFIADTYFYGKDLSKAVEIYNRYLNKEKESIQLFHFISCLYNLNTETEQALSLLKHWRQNYTFNPYITQYEYNLAVLLLDWQRCLDVVNYGLDHDPHLNNFAEFKILAMDKLNDKNINESLSKYLLSAEKTKQISAIAQILVKNRRSEDALVLLEKYYSDDDPSISMAYIMASVAYSQENEGMSQSIMIEHDTAEIGCFVKYESDGNIKFIELKNDSNQKLLVTSLIGKHKGEILELKRPMSNQTDEITVLRIMDKYLFLHDKIFDKADDPFSGLPMEVIHFNTSNDKSIVDVFKEIFGKDGDEREQHIKEIIAQYYSGEISYSEVIVNACAKDYIGGYYHLIYAQQGIRSIPKMIYDNQNICYDKPYIIDMSTLPMLYRLSEIHNIQYPNKFIISKHLVELIRNQYKELTSNPRSSMSIVTTSTEVTRIEHSEEQNASDLKHLSSLLDWIKDNCEERVSYKTSEWIRQLSKEENHHGNGQFIVDYILNTMLLREELDANLITEDLIYMTMLHLPLENSMSAEVYIKSILPSNAPALVEFTNLKYLGFDCPSFILIDEFEKRKKCEANSYTFMVENYAFISWRSFVDLIFHITVSCSDEEKKELKTIESAFTQYNFSKEITSHIRALIYILALQRGVTQEKTQFILEHFLNCDKIE